MLTAARPTPASRAIPAAVTSVALSCTRPAPLVMCGAEHTDDRDIRTFTAVYTLDSVNHVDSVHKLCSHWSIERAAAVRERRSRHGAAPFAAGGRAQSWA
ncbi:hypothetical protein GCM10027072_72530 [Streptomyces bullii]